MNIYEKTGDFDVMGLIYFLGSIALAALIVGVVTVYRNQDVFFHRKKHSA